MYVSVGGACARERKSCTFCAATLLLYMKLQATSVYTSILQRMADIFIIAIKPQTNTLSTRQAV